MGSTGSGSFSDYSKRKPSNSEQANGGSSGKNECGKAFSSKLEEVNRCFYYLNTRSVVPTNTVVNVFFNGIRIAVETQKGEELGYLPTRYNYLKNCLDDGFKYSGIVSASSSKSLPSITVDFIPNE